MCRTQAGENCLLCWHSCKAAGFSSVFEIVSIKKLSVNNSFLFFVWSGHGTIIRIGTTCKKIP